eukprot:gene1662-2005_t
MQDVFGYQEMFLVQAAACPPALQPPGGAIRSLVLAPTRELAAQIKAEAEKLLTTLGNSVGVQMVIGGTNINKERSGLSASRCDVLIATPGRLQDHLDTTQGFPGRLWGVQVLVLDEADRLLDMGFRPSIEAIMRYLPPATQRQSLMFSATLPQGVNEVASLLMRRDYVHVNTVTEDERPSHESITQALLKGAEQAFVATLGFLAGKLKQLRWNKDQLVGATKLRFNGKVVAGSRRLKVGASSEQLLVLLLCRAARVVVAAVAMGSNGSRPWERRQGGRARQQQGVRLASPDKGQGQGQGRGAGGVAEAGSQQEQQQQEDKGTGQLKLAAAEAVVVAGGGVGATSST